MNFDYNSIKAYNDGRVLEAEINRRNSGANELRHIQNQPGRASALRRLGQALSTLGVVFIVAVVLS